MDEGPLVRLGEGIIVDWNPDAWEMVYGKTTASDSRGGAYVRRSSSCAEGYGAAGEETVPAAASEVWPHS